MLFRYKEILTALVILCTFNACAKKSGAKPNEGKPDPTPVTGSVNVVNYDFETAIDFTTKTGGWDRVNLSSADRTQVLYAKGEGYKNSNCIKIIALPENGKVDVAITQKIKGMTPYTLYRMYARVKTSDVVGGRGAIICDMNPDQYWNASKHLFGTGDWRTVYTDFIADKNGETTIACRLGFYGNERMASGVVWFDDILITKMSESDMYIREGKYVKINLNKTQVLASDANMSKWIDQLDKVYKHYEELVGGIPYPQKVTVLSTPGIESGYWALAGYPILWNENAGSAITGSTKEIQDYGNWVFGILHEIGHVFNAGKENLGTNSQWNWNDELFANFRMNYALDMESESIIYINNTTYKSKDIQEMYKQAYNNSLGAGTDGKSGDAIHYTFCRIKNKYGWEPFKKAFRELYRLPESETTGLRNNYQKFIFFLSKVSKYAGEDVRTTYTVKELSLLERDM